MAIEDQRSKLPHDIFGLDSYLTILLACFDNSGTIFQTFQKLVLVLRIFAQLDYSIPNLELK